MLGASTAVVTPDESHNRPDVLGASTAIVTPDESHNRPDVVSASGGSASGIQFIYSSSSPASATIPLAVASAASQPAGSAASILLGTGSVSTIMGNADHWLQTVLPASSSTAYLPAAPVASFAATLLANQMVNIVSGTTGPDHPTAAVLHS